MSSLHVSHFKSENAIPIKSLKQAFHIDCMNELFSSFEIRYSTIFYASVTVYTATGRVATSNLKYLTLPSVG